MIEATFTLRVSDLDTSFLENLKRIFQSNGHGENPEIVVSVRPRNEPMLRQETREAYFLNLENSLDDARNGRNMVVFDSVEALEQHFQK